MQTRLIWLFYGFVFLSLSHLVLAETSKDNEQQLELGLSQSGIVAKVHVKLGDLVKAGQTLLSLDNTKFNADIQMAKAAIKRNQAHLNEAKREFERTKELHDQTLIASHEFELANNAYIAAQAALEQAKAELTKAQAILKETYIIAPIAGRVTALKVAPQQAVVNRCQVQHLITLTAP